MCRHEVRRRTRRRYWITNKHYQIMNVTLVCRASVTPTWASRTRRRECAGSGVTPI